MKAHVLVFILIYYGGLFDERDLCSFTRFVFVTFRVPSRLTLDSNDHNGHNPAAKVWPAVDLDQFFGLGCSNTTPLRAELGHSPTGNVDSSFVSTSTFLLIRVYRP